LKNSGRLPYPLRGPSILCVTQGRALLGKKGGGGRNGLSLRAGESAFIGSDAAGGLILDGGFTAFAAHFPES
jgi:hypothetical protein